jgi:hypothetical protein
VIDVFFNEPETGGASIFILYHAKLVDGTLSAGEDADLAAFFAMDQLPDLAFDSTRAFVSRFTR